MKLRLAEAVALLIVVAAFVAGIYIYPLMPDKVASHWGIDGEVNGFIPKFWGVYLMPIISAAMLVLFFIIPRVDPKKHNIEKFIGHFDGFIVLLFLFMAYIYGLTIAWNIGLGFVLIQWLAPALAILFYYCGVLISKAKMNWSIGIRTPWTLSSEKVWEEVHKTGGILFRVSGLLCLLSVVWPQCAVWFIMIPVLFSAVFSVVQSYVVYHREHVGKN
jgi:uncharacterized membrane protein